MCGLGRHRQHQRHPLAAHDCHLELRAKPVPHERVRHDVRLSEQIGLVVEADNHVSAWAFPTARGNGMVRAIGVSAAGLSSRKQHCEIRPAPSPNHKR
jgi:hypothetical protein